MTGCRPVVQVPTLRASSPYLKPPGQGGPAIRPGTRYTFCRLLRPAWPAVGLFFSPVTALVTPIMLQSLTVSNGKDSYTPRNQPTWLEQARYISASTGWETHVCPTACPVRFCSTRHGTAGGNCSNKSVLIGVVDIPWCMTGRCFSNWRRASEEDDFGRVPTSCLLVIFRRRFCYSSEQVHNISSVRCIAVLHFHTFSVFPLQCLKCINILYKSPSINTTISWDSNIIQYIYIYIYIYIYTVYIYIFIYIE